MDAYRICCLLLPTYFFIRTAREADTTRARRMLRSTFKILNSELFGPLFFGAVRRVISPLTGRLVAT